MSQSTKQHTDESMPIANEKQLFVAAMKGDIATVYRCLAAGIPVDAVDTNGFTPLINAAIFGMAEVARALLAAGADPNFHARSHLFRGNRTTTALEQARGNGHKTVVDMLLQAGAGDDSAQFAFDAATSIAKAAKQPGFQDMLSQLSVFFGSAPRVWASCKGAFSAVLKNLTPYGQSIEPKGLRRFNQQNANRDRYGLLPAPKFRRRDPTLPTSYLASRRPPNADLSKAFRCMPL